MNQFKRIKQQHESHKISHFLKVRILCQGEYFGEEEILNDELRKFRICCNSFEGKALMIKKVHFQNHVFQDEVSQEYILNRLKDKTHNVEERIKNMRNSLKDFKQFLFQDRQMTKQQILQKNILQKSQIKDAINSYDIIDKFVEQKLQRNNSQEKAISNIQRQSTLKGQSPIKGQVTLPALQSISSFNNFDQIEPISPSKQNASFVKQNTSLIKQNTALFSDILNMSPKQNKLKLKFQQTQSFTNLLPNKQLDITSTITTTKNYDKYINESFDKLSLSPIKHKETITKQVNPLNLNSTSKQQNSARVQSMTDFPEENQKKMNGIFLKRPEFNTKSLVVIDQETSKYEDENETIKLQNLQQDNQENNQLSNIQKFQKDSQTQMLKLKFQSNSEFPSADSSPFGNSPNKIITYRSSKVTPTSNSGIIKPQSTITNFSQQTDKSLNKQKQLIFSRKSLNTQILCKSDQAEEQQNQGLEQYDQNYLQKQIQQRINVFEQNTNQKNSLNNNTQKQKQRSSTQHTQGESPKRNNKFMIFNISNKDRSYEISKMDDYINYNLSPDLRHDSLNKSSKNNSTLSWSFNDNIEQNQKDEDYSPFLKKKLKRIANKKQSVDQALINLGAESKTYFLSKQIPIIVKPPVQNNQEQTTNEQNISIEKKQKLSFTSCFVICDKTTDNNQQEDILKLPKASFIKKPKTSNSKLSLRNSSIDNNSLKKDQLNMLQYQQSGNQQKEYLTGSHLQGVPENKKKIFLNMMNRSEVQQYFQKQMQMLNKANNIQQDKTQQSQLNVDDITSRSLKGVTEDKRSKITSASVDSLVKRNENNIHLQKQQNLKSIVFQNDSISPKKSYIQTASPKKIHEKTTDSQLPSLQNSQMYNFISEKYQTPQLVNLQN